MIQNNKEQVLKELTTRQQCRDRVPIWFESRENYYHPVLEVIVNAIDEITNNFKEGKILVKLHEDCRTITIKDTGRGIPIEGETNGKSNLDLLLLTLFAGGKYDQGNPTGGLNGVGNTVVCYTSDYMKVISNRTDKYSYIVEFCNGGEIKTPLTKVGKHKQTGTEITFCLSDEVYSNTKFDPSEIKHIVNRFSACSNKIEFTYEYNEKTEIFKYKTLTDYFNDKVKDNTCNAINSTINYNESEFVGMEIVLSVSSDPIHMCFLNNIYLRDGGSINDGIVTGIRSYINKYLKNTTARNKHKKITSAVTLEDVASSISFVCSVLSNKVEYRSQAKFATEKKLYKTISTQLVANMMKELESKPTNFDKFMTHICTISKFNQKTEVDKSKLKKKLNENINTIDNRVAKLVDCKIHGRGSQLFIAEGQSAMGSIVLARDASYQACYPLRGKILNCMKSNWSEIFKNEIIMDLIKVLACGTEYTKDFNIDNLRFDEIWIATDEDPDGSQIQILILTMIYTLMPRLIIEGKVRILRTPLFEITDLSNKKVYYAKSEVEKSEIIEKLDKYKISRNKGLGEVEPEVLHEFIKDTTHSPMVQCVSLEYCQNMFETWMATEVEPRKEIIERDLYKYISLEQ